MERRASVLLIVVPQGPNLPRIYFLYLIVVQGFYQTITPRLLVRLNYVYPNQPTDTKNLEPDQFIHPFQDLTGIQISRIFLEKRIII